MDDGYGESEWKEGLFVGSLRDRWPHRQAWNLPEEALTIPDGLSGEAIEMAMHETDKRYWDESLVAGALPICHHGCAYRDWLVITDLRQAKYGPMSALTTKDCGSTKEPERG
jgi:hypothetical protein